MQNHESLQSVSNPANSTRFLRWRELSQRIPLCRSRVHQMVAEGTFPAPVKLGGGHASAWVEAEIEAWCAQRIAERKADE